MGFDSGNPKIFAKFDVAYSEIRWLMKTFLNIIKVFLVYNPSYSYCFPPGFY